MEAEPMAQKAAMLIPVPRQLLGNKIDLQRSRFLGADTVKVPKLGLLREGRTTRPATQRPAAVLRPPLKRKEKGNTLQSSAFSNTLRHSI